MEGFRWSGVKVELKLYGIEDGERALRKNFLIGAHRRAMQVEIKKV